MFTFLFPSAIKFISSLNNNMGTAGHLVTQPIVTMNSYFQVSDIRMAKKWRLAEWDTAELKLQHTFIWRWRHLYSEWWQWQRWLRYWHRHYTMDSTFCACWPYDCRGSQWVTTE